MTDLPTAAALRERLAAIGLSVPKACKDAGISTDWFWQWEKGIRDPRISFVLRLVKIVEQLEASMGLKVETPAPEAGEDDAAVEADLAATPETTAIRVNKELVGWSWPMVQQRCGLSQAEMLKLQRGDQVMTAAQENYLATVAAAVAAIPLPSETVPSPTELERTAIRAYRRQVAAAIASVYSEAAEGDAQDSVARVAEILDLVDEVAGALQVAGAASASEIPDAPPPRRQPFEG